MDTSKIIGLKGGKDATFFEILAETGRGETKYYPSIKDGKELSVLDVGLDEYMAHKVERTRGTIRLLVAGNAVSAESALKNMGLSAMAIAPDTVDIYEEEGAL